VVLDKPRERNKPTKTNTTRQRDTGDYKLVRTPKSVVVGSSATAPDSNDPIQQRTVILGQQSRSVRAPQQASVNNKEMPMRQWIFATATSVSLALLGAVGQANALPAYRFTPAAIPSDVEQTQYIFGGRNYCWYDDGWRGPGFYWCGYAFRRGLGWGGGAGWRGWHGGHGGIGIGRPGGRPGIGRPGGGRPGFGGRPGGGRPGGGHPGGGRPGGGHPGGGRGHH
jgi:hypothetical protein